MHGVRCEPIASPAWFTDYVLTVASVTPDGQPSDFSLHGPWVDVAAPGERMTSLSPTGIGLINASLDRARPAGAHQRHGFCRSPRLGCLALVRSQFLDSRRPR